MSQNHDGKVRALAAQLDELVPREGAMVRIRDDLDEGMTIVRGNRQGYLRLGIEFLKAAFAAHMGERPDEVRVDVYYLLGQDEICFLFERNENIDETPAVFDSFGLKDALAACVMMAVVLFFTASCAAGMPEVADSLGDLISRVLETISL